MVGEQLSRARGFSHGPSVGVSRVSKASAYLLEGDQQPLVRVPTSSGSSSEYNAKGLCPRKRHRVVAAEPLKPLPVEVDTIPSPATGSPKGVGVS